MPSLSKWPSQIKPRRPATARAARTADGPEDRNSIFWVLSAFAARPGVWALTRPVRSVQKEEGNTTAIRRFEDVASRVLRDLFSIHLGPSLGEHAEPLDRRFRLCRSLLARIQIVGGLLAVEFCVALRVSEVVQQLLGGGVRTGLEIGLEASEKICAAWRE